MEQDFSKTYAIREKKPTMRACWALNCTANLLFSALRSCGGAFAPGLSAIVCEDEITRVD
jgi:hypothetical protein